MRSQLGLELEFDQVHVKSRDSNVDQARVTLDIARLSVIKWSMLPNHNLNPQAGLRLRFTYILINQIG